MDEEQERRDEEQVREYFRALARHPQGREWLVDTLRELGWTVIEPEGPPEFVHPLSDPEVREAYNALAEPDPGPQDALPRLRPSKSRRD